MKKILLLAAISAVSCQNSPSEAEADGASGATWVSELNYEGEDHFYGMRQLTDGGDNAEAYFSFDGSQLTFQSNAENGAMNVIKSMRSIGIKIPFWKKHLRAFQMD